jgi:hypothetical protein
MSLFHRMILGLAVAGALTGQANAAQVCYFGECGTVASSPAPMAPKAVAVAYAPKVLAAYGSWTVIAGNNGQRAIVDTFNDGSKLMIGKVNGEFVFLLADPRWALAEGQTFGAKVDIDGKVFSGTAHAIDGTTLAIESVSVNVLKAMYHGDKATIAIANYSWDINLVNASNALDAAAGLDPAVAN